jgi:lysophospholipase
MIRRGALLALVLTLAACGARGERDPFTDSRIPPSLGPAFWPPQGWAWGLIQQGEAPPQRYGVAAPGDEPPIAQVLVLPGYGGLAEEAFQTANLLTARRIQIWALDGVGQGGSGRIALPRDLGHVDSFADDVEGVRRMLAEVVRPTPDVPVVAIADGTAAPVLLRGLQQDQGLPGVAAVVLTAPRLPAARLASGAPAAGPVARWLRLGRYRAPGGAAWRREGLNAPRGSPAFVRHAWQLANPDLRMGGPSLGWLAAFDQLAREVRAAGWRRIALPVLVLVEPAAPAADRAEADRLCRALPRCSLAEAGAAQWPGREADFVAGVAAAAALPIPGPGR